MPPKGSKRDLDKFGSIQPRGENKWRVHLLDGLRVQCGPMRFSKELAEEDLRRARASGSRDAAYAFVKELMEQSCGVRQPAVNAAEIQSGGTHPAQDVSDQPSRKRLCRKSTPPVDDVTSGVSGGGHPACDGGVELLRKVRRLGTHPFDVLHGRHMGHFDGDAQPARGVEANILRAVRDLGRRPVQIKAPKNDAEKEERALAQRISRHYEDLSAETKSYLDSLQDYKWIKEIQVAFDELCLVRPKTSRSQRARVRELVRRCELMLEIQPYAVLQREKTVDGKITDWWLGAGASGRRVVPAWCVPQQGSSPIKRSRMPVWELHYHLSHQLLRDVRAFLSGAAHPAERFPSKLTYVDFYS